MYKYSSESSDKHNSFKILDKANFLQALPIKTNSEIRLAI